MLNIGFGRENTSHVSKTQSEPNACAQSSTTYGRKPNLWKHSSRIFAISSKSATSPPLQVIAKDVSKDVSRAVCACVCCVRARALCVLAYQCTKVMTFVFGESLLRKSCMSTTTFSLSVSTCMRDQGQHEVLGLGFRVQSPGFKGSGISFGFQGFRNLVTKEPSHEERLVSLLGSKPVRREAWSGLKLTHFRV